MERQAVQGQSPGLHDVGLPSVGLLGVGLLGTALAERMLRRFAVCGYDPRPHQLTHLVTVGGQAADSAERVASSSDILVLCLPDSRVTQQALEELGGRLRAGTLLIDATTGDPDDTAALAARLRERKIGYVDATIAGSSEQARRGEAVAMLGGEPADLARAEPIVAAWTEKRFVVGPPGSGARLKLIVNLVLGLNRAVLAEGLALAEAAGLDPAAALEVLRATPAYSAAMDTKGQKMIARDYAPVARLGQHLKDVRLIRELARRAGAHVPLSAAHEELLAQAVERGLSDADNSALIEVFRQPPFRQPPGGQAPSR